MAEAMERRSSKDPIELLSPKQNGSIEMERNAQNKAANKATIKSMWKKAFKSLKTRESRPIEEKSDKTEQSAGHRKVQSTSSSRQSSFRKSLLRRKDSKERESDQETTATDDHDVDPVYSLLKCAADLPRQHKLGHGHACCMRTQLPLEGAPSAAPPSRHESTSSHVSGRNSRSSSPSSDPEQIQGCLPGRKKPV